MKYKLFGKSGLRVSEIALGTMTFGEDWGWGASHSESKKIFDLFANEGGNFIDTANNYTNGTSEKYVGEFVKSDRDHFVIATKYTLSTNPNDPNAHGNHRKNMIRAVEASLRRMEIDHLDILWVHVWDFTTPEEEILKSLDALVTSGKVLYIGISDTPAWIVSRANTIAELRGWTQFTGLQIQYSLIQRTAERDLLPMANSLDVAVTPWGAIGAGLLSGKYTRGNLKSHSRGEYSNSLLNDRNLTIARTVDKIADRYRVSSSAVALAWSVQSNPGVIIPIVGARNEKQLAENLQSVKVSLTSEDILELNEVSKIELGFPHDFLNAESVKKVIHGNSYDKIINHRES
ncbi:MAG: oxidoreductase [Melioribacteraceae bacterium]|nr:MAG: oxidoreductase [Melioribacteraceae bacterium]